MCACSNRPSVLRAVVAAGLVLLGLTAHAQRRAVNESLLQKDFPCQGACISAKFPKDNVALKGLALRVGSDAAVLFDTDLCRMAAGWTGGYINTHGVAFDGAHGAHPEIVGEQKFGTPMLPGAAGPDGDFKDTRTEPFGPIDPTLVRWDGLYVRGMDVGLTYTIRGTRIVEHPSSIATNGEVAFWRTFRLEPPKPAGFFRRQVTPQGFSILLAEVEGVDGAEAIGVVPMKSPNGQFLQLTMRAGDKSTRFAAVGLPKGVALERKAGRLWLSVPQGTKPATFRIVIWSGPASVTDAQFATLAGPPSPVMPDFASGGPAHWPEPVMVKGELNTSQTPDGAYVTDRITAPEKNPWNRRVRFGGFDFFRDGKRAAFCTHDGDIWIVSGIDDTLEHLEWRRFASGLYETLGLVIVDDVIYTAGRDGITRYRDLNGDGEADFYENFNNRIMSTQGFHEFVFDLQRDAAGNFYFAKANPVNGGGSGFGSGGGNGTVCSHAGCVFKVSPDGRKFEVIARGLRAPNGIGVSPEGQVTASDNEGTWVPSTPLHWVKPGNFLGVVNKLTPTELAERFTPPLTWLSHNDYDNSGGGQIWVTSERWGPYHGELLHESYGKSSLFLVMKQSLPDGRMQGGVVRFPLKFTSSVMRARFHPHDGQLYVAGLSEWQSNAARGTGFDRVRYTGKPVYSVRGLAVVPGGVELTFSQPLDRSAAEDAQSWSGKRWNYLRTENYGSPEKQVKEPGKNGREPLNITAAKLSADGRTVTLSIEDLRPVMQQSIKWELKAKDGTPIAQEIQHTVHQVPGAVAAVN